MTSPILPLESYFFGALSSFYYVKDYKLTLGFTLVGFVLISDLLARPFDYVNGSSSYSARFMTA